MVSVEKTAKDIKALKIQGANNVAAAAIDSIKEAALGLRTKDISKLYHYLDKQRKLLEETRPTEPCLRNSMEYIFKNTSGIDEREFREEFVKRCVEAKKFLKAAENEIAEIGAAKIKDGMTVFTHCHSSTVVSIMKKAFDQGRKFEVHNTETRPLFQGRKTAKELANHGIKVTHYVDAAARFALKKCDLMLIGCDAITSEGKVINKIGSELFAEVADKYEIPIYSCTNSWKFDPKTIFLDEKIEGRYAKEVWENPPKRVKVSNYAFEQIDPDTLTGIISEIGVFKAEVFIEEVRRVYPWMFNK